AQDPAYHPAPPVPVGVEEADEPMLLTRRGAQAHPAPERLHKRGGRVPQARLAPELPHKGRGAAAADLEGPLPDAAEARAALSRYQASRQAARAVAEERLTAQDGTAGRDGA